MRKYFLLAVVAGGALAFTLQRPDLAASLDGTAAVLPQVRDSGASVTSAKVDIANYGAAALVVVAGRVDAEVGVILQDSGSAHSWTSIDTITVDTAATVSKYYDLTYSGNQRYLRAILNEVANPALGDTNVVAAMIVTSFKRSR